MADADSAERRRRAGSQAVKRLLDASVSALGLAVLTPVLVVIAIAVRLDSPGPALFRQVRVGRGMRPFTLYKFRTMRADRGGAMALRLAVPGDPRITRVGRWLRQTKLDELPQLINVLKGDMSLVGPRPEVAPFVDAYRQDFRDILRVRPGITDLASLRFRDEAALLGETGSHERQYVERILPKKIALAKWYVARSSLGLDLLLIGKTVSALVWKRGATRGRARKIAR